MKIYDIEYVFAQLGFLIKGYLMRLGLTQGIWDAFKNVISQSIANNAWYTEESIKHALSSIQTELLAPRKLSAWLSNYDLSRKEPRKVGIIMAGNIPLVGMHDLLCVICSGNHAVIKLSRKDPFLLPMLAQQMFNINYRMQSRIAFTPHICAADIDAIIATGSDNAAAAFNSEYGFLPHIFRQNKTSAAILNGEETHEEIQALIHDMLDHCGMGCRSVSKLFVKDGYDFQPLKEKLEQCSINNQNYMQAYRYASALSISNGENILDCGCCILKQSSAFNPLIAQVFYEYYSNAADLFNKLEQCRSILQCLVSRNVITGFERFHADFGYAQRPALTDYSDGVDTMNYLCNF